MNYRTLADMARLCRDNVHRIPRVSVVAGIPRSGMIAASTIATLTNQALEGYYELENLKGILDSILLVDDSISGGETMSQALGYISSWHPKAKITTLAVFLKPTSMMIPDIHFEIVPGPRVFEWNWHRSKHLSSAVLDIDGVISTETAPGERNGLLLYRPARRVLALATGRHEREREVTADWLMKHEVRYNALFMSSSAQRSRTTKVLACELAKPKWFVESNIHQAEFIRARTGLPVLCTDANRMLTS